MGPAGRQHNAAVGLFGHTQTIMVALKTLLWNPNSMHADVQRNDVKETTGTG